MPKVKLILVTLGLSSVLLVNGLVLAAEEAKKEPTKQPEQQVAVPDPVAIVNGIPIPKAFYESYAQQRQGQRGSVNTPEARKALTDELVIQERHPALDRGGHAHLVLLHFIQYPAFVPDRAENIRPHVLFAPGHDRRGHETVAGLFIHRGNSLDREHFFFQRPEIGAGNGHLNDLFAAG